MDLIRLSLAAVVAWFIQMIVVGAAIGAMYKPTAQPKAADVAV